VPPPAGIHIGKVDVRRHHLIVCLPRTPLDECQERGG
jgi:hypothetical protein